MLGEKVMPEGCRVCKLNSITMVTTLSVAQSYKTNSSCKALSFHSISTCPNEYTKLERRNTLGSDIKQFAMFCRAHRIIRISLSNYIDYLTQLLQVPSSPRLMVK